MTKYVFFLICTLFIGASLYGLSSPVHNYYVSPGGSDSNNGSLSQPWKTIAHALVMTGPGDTVNLRAGSYTEKLEMRGDAGNQYGHSMGGSSAGWWTLQSFPGETATLDGGGFAAYSLQYSRFRKLNFTNGAGIYVGTVDWSTPRGARSHHIEILDNTFSGTQVRYGFIHVMFDKSLVEGNRVTIAGGGSTTDHGLYLHNGDQNTVRGNVISGASGYDIHVYDERKGGSDPQTMITNVVVENNVLSGSRLRSGLIISQGNDTVVSGVMVRNNIVFGNNQYGIDLTNYGVNNMNAIMVYNNTFYQNGSGGLLIGKNAIAGSEIRNNIFFESGAHILRYMTGPMGMTVSNNLYWPGAPRLTNVADGNARVGDPLFANVGERDFHLHTGSAAIGTASPLSAITLDKDGLSRPAGSAPDMGAYEHSK